jgi:hypothetical protein
MKTLVALILCSLLTGCISRGKAKEAHVKFGVPMIFSVQKDETGIDLRDGKLKAADSSTNLSIGPFIWASHGKDVEIDTK